MRNTAFFIVFVLILGLWGCGQGTKKSNTATLSEAEKAVYLEKGKTIAGATFATLSAQLQAVIQAEGVTKAIEYCNLNAYPLVDSLSKAHQAQIRRTTLKERNPANRATAAEQIVLEEYAHLAATGAALSPIVKQLDDQTIAFYAPIQVNALCLQCHGKIGETLKVEDYAVIQQHYPDDQATGYVAGDLRGMWSIQFRPQ